MDRNELIGKLQGFKANAEKKGRPIDDICVEEAFPGDDSTSYIVQVKAKWVDAMDCSEALDFLFDILWETTDEDTRKSVFSIQVLDSEDELHCSSRRSLYDQDDISESN